jgi:hypothetical protein
MKGIIKTAAAALTGIAGLVGPLPAQQIGLSSSGLAYTQDFNSLPNTGTGTLPAGWSLFESGSSADSAVTADNGSNVTADSYSYGPTGAAERALAVLSGSGFTGWFGASFENLTGASIGSIQIAYTGEQWRLGTAGHTDSLFFEYSTNATSVTSGIFKALSDLDFKTLDTSTPGGYDGNITREARSGTIVPGVKFTGTTPLWIRWRNPYSGVAEDGLAVDDLSVTPWTIPTSNGSWNVDGDGSWSAAANWSGGVVPDGRGSTATLGALTTAPRTVTLDSPRSLGWLVFNSAQSYTIAGKSTLTLAGPDGINSELGSHQVAAPLRLDSGVEIRVATAGDTLTIISGVTGPGMSLTKTGAGVLRVKHLRVGRVEIMAGSVPGSRIVVAPSAQANDPDGVSRIDGAPLFAGSGAPITGFDLTNNALIIDYPDGPVPISLIRSFLRTGYSNGAWAPRSITSSMADRTRFAMGYADNSVTNFTEFAGQPVDSSTILIKYTHYGDTDLDGDVDADDLGVLASSWLASGIDLWTDGDFDYTGQVSVQDLGLLATNWQAGVTRRAGPALDELLSAYGLPRVHVPEPAAALAVTVVGVLARRRR